MEINPQKNNNDKRIKRDIDSVPLGVFISGTVRPLEI